MSGASASPTGRSHQATKKLRILIADDHGIVRKGLRLLLEQNENFEVIGEASDGREAVRMAEELVPDVVIMDIAESEWYSGDDSSGEEESANRGHHPQHVFR